MLKIIALIITAYGIYRNYDRTVLEAWSDSVNWFLLVGMVATLLLEDWRGKRRNK